MKGKLFTLEKAPFLTIASVSCSLTFKYFEDLRKALPQSAEWDHAFTLFSIFLATGALSLGIYITLLISEKHVTRNMEKTKRQDRSNRGPRRKPG